MRPLLLLSLLLACTGCSPQLVLPGVGIRAGANLRAEARVEAAVPLQGAAVVEFFGVPLEGAQDVVFVLDRSGSMSQQAQGSLAQLGSPGAPGQVLSKIDIAHNELIDALERLPDGTRMNVIFFNRSVQAYAQSIVPLEAPAREGLVEYVRAMGPDGPTALAPALRIAFLMNPQRVVLLSDGLGNVGGDAQDILRDARAAMRGGMRIDTIGLGADQDAALMRALATESGGLYQAL